MTSLLPSITARPGERAVAPGRRHVRASSARGAGVATLPSRGPACLQEQVEESYEVPSLSTDLTDLSDQVGVSGGAIVAAVRSGYRQRGLLIWSGRMCAPQRRESQVSSTRNLRIRPWPSWLCASDCCCCCVAGLSWLPLDQTEDLARLSTIQAIGEARRAAVGQMRTRSIADSASPHRTFRCICSMCLR